MMNSSRALPVVLHVAPISSNLASGLAYSIPGLVGALHRLDVPVGILTTSSSDPYGVSQPYPVMHSRNLSRLSLSSLPSPFNQPNLIVFHSTYIGAHAKLAHEAYCGGVPYIITPRGGMTQGAQQIKSVKKRIGNFLFFNAMVHHAAAVHCLSSEEAADVVRWGCPVFVVGNGVELPQRSQLAEPGKGEPLRFVFVGRFDVTHKGLDLLIKACSLAKARLIQSGVQIHFYGSDVRGGKAFIKALTNAHGLDAVVTVHDPVYGEEKAAILQNADVFLHTSRFEGHPMAVLEALSYGVPCLLTPGTNMTREVAAFAAGWTVQATPESIAKGLIDILDSRAELALKGISARQLIEKNYSWDEIGKQVLEKYLDVLRK